MLGLLGKYLMPAVAAGGLAVGGFAGFKVGQWAGVRAGVAQQEAEQALKDAEVSEEIRERVRDAIDEVGAAVSDSDVDAILRQLAGE